MNDSLIAQFSNRELAVVLWVLAFTAWALSLAGVRKSIGSILRQLLQWKLSVPIVILAAYTCAVVRLLAAVDLWTRAEIKDTVLWFLFAGLGLAGSALEHSKSESFWRDALGEQLRILVLVEWVVSSYTFSLPVELALVPLLAIVAMFDAVAKSRDEFKGISRLTGALLVTAGLGLMTVALVGAVRAFSADAVPGAVRSLILAPILTTAILPIVFLFAVLSTYEILVIRLGCWRDGRAAFGKYAARRIMLHCALLPHRVHAFSRKYLLELLNLRTSADLRALLDKSRAGLPSEAEADESETPAQTSTDE